MSDWPVKDWRGTARRALSATEVVSALARLEAWTLDGDGKDVGITRCYRFANYHETIAFVNLVAVVAHTQDHHPDLAVHYDRCVVRFHTHDVAGLSQTDFDCATRIDAILAV